MGVERLDYFFPRPTPVPLPDRAIVCCIQSYEAYCEGHSDAECAMIEYALELDYWGDDDHLYY